MSRRARSALALLLGCAAAALAVVVAIIASGSGTAATKGFHAPAFTAPSATGHFDLNAVPGHVTVLAFVQAGCGSCAGELRSYAKLAPATPDTRFVALNLPGGGSARDLAGFGAQVGATRDIAYVADADGKIARRYGVTIVDTVVVVDRAGRVRARLIRPSESALHTALAA